MGLRGLQFRVSASWAFGYSGLEVSGFEFSCPFVKWERRGM